MNAPQRIAKNISVLVGSDIISRIMGFVFVIHVARRFDETGLGMYAIAFSFAQFFSLISNFGLIEVMTRDVSRDRNLSRKYMGNIGLIKICLSVVAMALLVGVLRFTHYASDTKMLIIIVAAYEMIMATARVFSGTFRAYEKMEYEALLVVGERIVSVTLGLIIMLSGGSLVQSVLAYIVGGILSFALGYIVVVRKFSKPSWKIDLAFCRDIMKTSLPFALSLLFFTVYLRVDIVMLSLLKGEADAGVYSAAQRLAVILLFVPKLYAHSLFPMMSRFYQESKESLSLVYEKSLRYLTILGVPISVGLFMFADRLMPLFFGEGFSRSVVAMKVLAWFVILKFFENLTGVGLVSTNRQNQRVRSQGIAAFLNISLNLLLIPRYSYIGAGIATICSEIVLIGLYVYFMPRENRRLPSLRFLMKPAVASIVMAMLVKYVLTMHLVLAIPIAGLSYIAVLFILRTFDSDDYEIFGRLFKRRRPGLQT